MLELRTTSQGSGYYLTPLKKIWKWIKTENDDRVLEHMVICRVICRVTCRVLKLKFNEFVKIHVNFFLKCM